MTATSTPTLNKSVRLTKAMREEIVSNVRIALEGRLEFSHSHGEIEAFFNKETRALDYRFIASDANGETTPMSLEAFRRILDRDLILEVHGQTHGDIMNVYNSLSQEDKLYFRTHNHFNIQVNDDVDGQRKLVRNINWLYLKDDEGKPFSIPTKGSGYLTVSEGDEALVKYESFLKSIRKIQKEFTNLREAQVTVHVAQTHEVVHSVNTTRQLEDLWPEVVNFLPKYLCDPSSITLPAVLSDMSAVNEALKSVS